MNMVNPPIKCKNPLSLEYQRKCDGDRTLATLALSISVSKLHRGTAMESEGDAWIGAKKSESEWLDR